MATARLCGLSPLLFRRKHYKFEGKRILNMVKGNKEKGKEVKGVKIVKPPGCPKNLKLMANLKKKIMQFRDTIDLPPSDSSKSLAQLMIRTIKDLQYMYPEMSPRIQVSKLKGASMDQILANFYKTLKWIEDSWRMDQDSDFFECDVHINPDQRVENIIGTLESLMKLTAENFDTMEDGDEKKSSSPESNTYGKIVESNSDSCNNSLCASPVTPTSVLPELIKAANASCTSPLLMSLRVQAMGKLNPIDVKRLAFHMLPHLRIQDPRNSSFQKNRITEEQVQDANSDSEVKKTDHIEEVKDDSTKIQTATDSSITQAEVSSPSSLQPDYSPSVESLQPTPPTIPVLNTTISASPTPTPTPPPQPPPLQPNITTPRPMPPPPPLPSRISGPAAAPSPPPPPPGMLGSVPSTPPPPPPLPGMPGAAPPPPPTTPVLHTTISTSPTPTPPPPPLQPNVTTARPMPPPPPPPARTSGHAAAPPPPSPPLPRMSGAAPPPPPPMMPLKVSTMPPPTSQISEPAAPPPPSPPGMLASASSTPPPQPGMLGSSSSTPPPPPPPPPPPRTSGAAPPSPSPMMPLKVSTMPPPTSRISEPAAPPPPPLPGMLASASSTPSPPPGMLGSSSSKPPPPRTSGAAPPPPSPMMPLKGSAMPPPPSQVSGPAAPPPPPPPPGMLGSASSTSPSPPGKSGASPPPPQHIMPLKGSAMPPPMPLANGAAPPPPPALGAGRSLRPKKATKLKRSSQMGNLYRILRGKVEGTELSKSHGGRKSRGAVAAAGGKEGMADALAEMTKRSAYFQQIEEDVEKHAKSITELKSSISTFQTKDMAELLNFHKHVESILEKLTDESQVLARFEGFPSKKLEALRTAAALYSKLDAMSTELQNWKIVAPLGQLLDKVEHYFNKIKGDIEALERTKDEESKKFQSHNIHFDFSILIKIKELMVDVSSNCMELALKLKSREAELADVSGNKDEGRKKESVKMLWRAFQFAFRVYTFAGGHDDRADNLTRELAHEIEADPNHQ